MTNRIEIHGKDDCPWCDKAAAFFKARNIKFDLIKYNDPVARNKMYDNLGLKDGQRTVPQIFMGDEHIGSYAQMLLLNRFGTKTEDLMGITGLLTERVGYKPLKYPWAYDMWQKQQQVHWLPEEVPLGEDVKDWATNLTEPEKNLLTQIFRFFTQADIEVQDNYMERYSRVFKPTEVKMMLAAFANMETVHIAAYALLLETIGMPESEFSTFMEYKAMKDKHDYMSEFGVETPSDVLRTLAMFGGFAEGLQLFASFAILMNFPRRNLMKGMGQIVSWSVRDESLHCDGIIKLYHSFAKEIGGVPKDVAEDIIASCHKVIEMEDKFIDLAFEQGDIEGLSAQDIKDYIRFIADWRLRQLKLPEQFGGRKDNPLPWLQALLSGVEHANFFEARSTEYSKAATQGKWDGPEGVWAQFDREQVRRQSMTGLQPEE